MISEKDLNGILFSVRVRACSLLNETNAILHYHCSTYVLLGT